MPRGHPKNVKFGTAAVPTRTSQRLAEKTAIKNSMPTKNIIPAAAKRKAIPSAPQSSNSRRTEVDASSSYITKMRRVVNPPLASHTDSGPVISRSHEIEIEENPTMSVLEEGSKSGNNVEPCSSSSRSTLADSAPVAISTLPKITRPFFHENVAGWKYRGNPYLDSFAVGKVQSKLRSLMWHEIKQLTGKDIMDVKVDLLPKDNPAVLENVLKFTVSKLSVNRGRVIPLPYASIEVSAVPGKKVNTYFTFDISNEEVANEYEVTVRILRQACERVFDTIVLRCERKNGGPLGCTSSDDDDDHSGSSDMDDAPQKNNVVVPVNNNENLSD